MNSSYLMPEQDHVPLPLLEGQDARQVVAQGLQGTAPLLNL